MRKLKRRKIIKEFLEERIAKNHRRIQKIGDETYKLRMQLEALNAIPVQKPLTKGDREAAAKAAEEAAKVATEAVMDSADQEIGGNAPVEEKTDAVS